MYKSTISKSSLLAIVASLTHQNNMAMAIDNDDRPTDYRPLDVMALPVPKSRHPRQLMSKRERRTKRKVSKLARKLNRT